MIGNNQYGIIDTNEFIKRSKELHGDLYRYDLAEYKNTKSKVLIYCNACKDYFEQPASGHLGGKGCFKCGIQKMLSARTDKVNNYVSEFSSKNKTDTKLLEIYEDVNGRKRVKYYCKQHDIRTSKLSTYKKNKGCCSKCMEKPPRIQQPHWKKSFGATREGWLKLEKEKYFLYLVKFESDDEIFYKIGITVDFKKRTAGFKYNNTEYKIIESVDGGLLYDLEKQLHKEFKDLAYIPKIRFGGWTECFNPDERISKRFNHLKIQIEKENNENRLD